MKMRSQIIALGLAGVAAAAATGGIGLLSGRHLGGTIGDVIGTSQALQHSQEADMMHDAVRGDASWRYWARCRTSRRASTRPRRICASTARTSSSSSRRCAR